MRRALRILLGGILVGVLVFVIYLFWPLLGSGT